MSVKHRYAQQYSDLTSPEVIDAVRDQTLVWPIGSVEQHGPHLPLSVDLLLAEDFGNAIAEGVGGLVLPTLSIGARSLPQSGGGLHFPGTLYLQGASLLSTLTDTLSALRHLPYGQLIVVNGHFENEALVFEAIDSARDAGYFGDRSVAAFSWWSLTRDEWIAENLPDFPGWHAEHAGLTETSLMMHLHPDLVRPQRPIHLDTPRSGIYAHPIDPTTSTTEGVLSSTVGASEEIGNRLFLHVLDQALSLIRTNSNNWKSDPDAGSDILHA